LMVVPKWYLMGNFICGNCVIFAWLMWCKIGGGWE
jgi:hypothetical protein